MGRTGRTGRNPEGWLSPWACCDLPSAAGLLPGIHYGKEQEPKNTWAVSMSACGGGNTEVRPGFGVGLRKERKHRGHGEDRGTREGTMGFRKRDIIIIEFSIK